MGLAAGVVVGGVSTSQTAEAIPADGAKPDSKGTSSSVWPTTFTTGDIASGNAVINFTVSGYGKNELVNIKIDDGLACTDTSHGACVYHQQRLDGNGSATGSFTLPSDLAAGAHWLRMLGTEKIYEDGQYVGYEGFTRRGGNDFTIVEGAATKSGTGQLRGSGDVTKADGPSDGSGTGGSSSSSSSSGSVDTSDTGTLSAEGAQKVATTVSHDTAMPELPIAGDYELISSNNGGFEATQDGTSVTVSLGDTPAGQSLYVVAFSEPTPLGWVDASEEQKVTIDIGDLPEGSHKLAFIDPEGTLVGWVSASHEAAKTSSVVTVAGVEVPLVGIITLGVAVLAAAGLIIWVLVRKPKAQVAAAAAAPVAGAAPLLGNDQVPGNADGASSGQNH